AGLLSIWLAVARFRIVLRWPGIGAIRQRFRESFQYFVAILSSSVSSSFNTLVLGFAATNQVVGYYAAAEKLFIAMRAAFYPIVQALYPYMSHRRDMGLYRRIFYVTIGGAIVGAAIVFGLSQSITELVLGVEFAASAELLRLFALLVPLVAASLLLSYPLLAALGREKYANFPLVIGAFIHVVLVLSLLPMITASTLILILLITETAVLVMRVYGVKKLRLWRTREIG
ncbi:MAG: oligosaccharide flippase family protein, partial [Candidatus Zixiibacteriota bacterium]